MAANFIHPEQKPGERFWNNLSETDLTHFRKSGLTIRRGTKTFRNDNNQEFHQSGIFPVFVLEEELTEKWVHTGKR